MREKSTFTDEEFKDYAERVVEKYPRFFPEDLDLSKFFFIRTESVKPKWISKIRKIGHPWGSLPGLDEVIYLIETASECWEPLTEAQRVLTVFHELKHVPEGGCDYDSSSCGKLEDHPIQDFPECIAAANGNLFWYEPGHGDELPNILVSASFDLEEALKRTGYINDESRKSPESLEEIGVDDSDVDTDIASALVKDLEEKKHKVEIDKIKRSAAEGNEAEKDETTSDVVVEEV